MMSAKSSRNFAQFKVDLINYERHRDHIEAAFAGFLLRHKSFLPLNVDKNIVLGYPDLGALPSGPTNVISAFIVGHDHVSETEKHATESFLIRTVLEPFKNNLLTEGPYKDRQDIVKNICLTVL